jgi:hypothetical protein
MTTLSHNQQIRVASFSHLAQAITVGTIHGYAVQNGECPEVAMERAKKFGHEIAWANQAPAVLTSDYAGKAEDLAAERAKRDAAVVIEDGEQVLIEGVVYKVRVMGERFSDPVHFIPA